MKCPDCNSCVCFECGKCECIEMKSRKEAETNEIWTIELNLDDDFASSCAYHVDELKNTINRNVCHAEDGRKTNRWCLVGLAYSHEEAGQKSTKLQKLLCKRNNKKEKYLFDQ